MLLDIFDPKAPPKAIGIDLGTTNSVVAHVRDGRATALINCDGSSLLPSVVHFHEAGHVVVGGSAQSYASRSPEQTIISAKRFMGRGAKDPQTQVLGAYRFAEPTSPEEERVVRFDVGREAPVTPVEVSAEILKSLGHSALDQLNAIGGAVITVPAYFDDAQRQATRDAGKLAGLEVLRLINEPTAAALAYGLEKKQNGLFAVYDFGGGTFDVTILMLDDGVFQVKSTGGDSALGGDDMDRLIAERMLPDMGFESKSTPPAIISLALEAARKVKHGLTDSEQVAVALPRKGSPDETHEFVITRAELDELIEPLLVRTGRACRRALRDAGVSREEIDGVILVGGSTRVPRVRSHVAELFGQPPLSDIDPDLVVAYGAAIQADLLSTSSDDVLLLDVLSLSLGLETMGGGIDKVLPRNTPIPAGARSTFTTFADDQTGFELHVVQGEREMAADCRSLAKFTLKGIPPMPAGMARLEVNFDVDADGLLQVRARELTTGVEQSIEVKPSYGLSDDEIEDMLIDALDHGEDDFERRRLADARVEAERIVAATAKALEVDADLLEPGEGEKVRAAISELQRAVETATRAGVLQQRSDELDDATHDWAGRRMDRAIRRAVTGKAISDVEKTVENARGIEEHLEQSAEQARAAGVEPVRID